MCAFEVSSRIEMFIRCCHLCTGRGRPIRRWTFAEAPGTHWGIPRDLSPENTESSRWLCIGWLALGYGIRTFASLDGRTKRYWFPADNPVGPPQPEERQAPTMRTKSTKRQRNTPVRLHLFLPGRIVITLTLPIRSGREKKCTGTITARRGPQVLDSASQHPAGRPVGDEIPATVHQRKAITS